MVARGIVFETTCFMEKVRKRANLPAAYPGNCQVIDSRLRESLGKAASPAEKTECFDAAHETWELLLTNAYHELLGLCTPKQQLALREAQRLWLLYRDNQFASIDQVYAGLDNGILSPDSSAAKMEITRSRALQMLQMRDKLRKANQPTKGKS
jgi:uncharacterized protein YecT (DUF1311 family)